MVKHAIMPGAGQEYSVCGLAIDAYESGDESEPVLFANAGEVVTCRLCREIVGEIRQMKIGRLSAWKEGEPS